MFVRGARPDGRFCTAFRSDSSAALFSTCRFIADAGLSACPSSSTQPGKSKPTPPPPSKTKGGTYYRKPGTDEPDGHIAELPIFEVMAKRPPMPKASVRKNLNDSLNVWLSNGFTTVVSGA